MELGIGISISSKLTESKTNNNNLKEQKNKLRLYPKDIVVSIKKGFEGLYRKNITK